MLKAARFLHEDLRNYGNLEDKNKPLIVSGILLALSEIEQKNFDISDLIGDKIRTDGSKIHKAIEDNLKRANVSPEVKRDKLLNQFNIIKDNNEGDGQSLGIILTPRHITDLFCELLDIQPPDKVLDLCCGFHIIIMTRANSQVNTRLLELLPKFKIKKMNRWYAV